MSDILLDELPVAVIRLCAQRNAAREVVDFIWLSANQAALSALCVSSDEIARKKLSELKDLMPRGALMEAAKRAVTHKNSSSF
jgi:PAS domain-containing protein